MRFRETLPRARLRLIEGFSVRVDNDAKSAALAEALWGAGVGYHIVFYATLGTGIGTGVIFDKRIYHGRTGSATEGGHMTIDYRGPRCNCGKRGCIEALACGTAFAARARARLAKSGAARSKLLDLAAGNLDQVHAETLGEAFRLGDSLATAVLEETADLLTIWLGNMIDFLEPEVILLGGGVSDLMTAFFGRMRENLPRWCINPFCGEIPLLRAKYGHEAGIAGAAALCRV